MCTLGSDGFLQLDQPAGDPPNAPDLGSIQTVEDAYQYAISELSGVPEAEIREALPREAEALGYDPTTVEGAIAGAEILVFG